VAFDILGRAELRKYLLGENLTPIWSASGRQPWAFGRAARGEVALRAHLERPGDHHRNGPDVRAADPDVADDVDALAGVVRPGAVQ
jgi:hypothetical protein